MVIFLNNWVILLNMQVIFPEHLGNLSLWYLFYIDKTLQEAVTLLSYNTCIIAISTYGGSL